VAVTATVLAALLAAATLTAPASLARPGGGGARPPASAGDLASLRAKATRLRATLDEQHRRLEVRGRGPRGGVRAGVELLADASRLDRRRRTAERELAVTQAELHERARSTYIAGPGWFVSGLVGADNPARPATAAPLVGACGFSAFEPSPGLAVNLAVSQR
jgi:hypothetical protein